MKENTSLQCPVEKTIEFLGQKWTMLILRHLETKKVLRFNELLTLMKDISPRTLSKRLKELEEEKYIVKKKYNELPPKVEYSLTEKGKAYGKFLEQFNKLVLEWENKH